MGANLNLCASSKCKTKKKNNNILIPVVASVGGLVLLLFIAAAVLLSLKKKKRQGIPSYIQYASLKNSEEKFYYAHICDICT